MRLTALMQVCRDKRTRSNLPLKRVAHRLNTSENMMHKYETGELYPRKDRLRQLLSIVGLKLALIDTSDGTVWDVSGDQPRAVPTPTSRAQTVLLGPRNGTSSVDPSSPQDN